MAKLNVDDRLDDISDLLDINLEIRKEVETIYENLSAHLARNSSTISQYNPLIYPQGSFRIQTVVKPFSTNGDIDVDIVCRLNLTKDKISKQDLKTLIGVELKSFSFEGIKLKESGRCWTLYIGERLHIDVLPSIPNEEAPPDGIHLTDRELHHWQTSNPIKYADWFKDRCEINTIYSETLLRKAEVEDFPNLLPKLSLQKSVQLLKRHRDVYFKERGPCRSPSILITTLMAKMNTSDQDIFAKIKSFSKDALGLIDFKDGKYILLNPSDENENFADKWNQDIARRDYFVEWIDKLKKDLDIIENAFSFDHLESVFGVKDLIKQSSQQSQVSEVILKSLGSYLIPMAEALSHLKSPTWPMQKTQLQIKVVGTLHNSHQGKKIGIFSQNLPIRKGRWIKFRLETDAPADCEVYWQVANTGTEARNDNDLRGGIEQNPSGKTHWESAKYKGTHFIVAHIVKNGMLLASSDRIKVLIS